MINRSGELRLPLATLTPKGIRAFRELVGAAPGMDISVAEKTVLEIASGAATANKVSDSVTVPLFPDLATRHDTATLVMDLLNDAGIDAGPSSGHDDLFSWLALIFLPSLCRRTKSGSIATGQMYRYVLSRSTSDFYRHLVACPHWLLRQYGKSARIFLAQEAFVMPDVVEQIVSRPTLIDSRGVVEVVDRLYWDEPRNAPKKGFTTTIRQPDPPPGYSKSSPAPGTLRALEWTLGQLQCTHDLRSMNADQIIDKLPAEFASWANGTTV